MSDDEFAGGAVADRPPPGGGGGGSDSEFAGGGLPNARRRRRRAEPSRLCLLILRACQLGWWLQLPPELALEGAELPLDGAVVGFALVQWRMVPSAPAPTADDNVFAFMLQKCASTVRYSDLIGFLIYDFIDAFALRSPLLLDGTPFDVIHGLLQDVGRDPLNAAWSLRDWMSHHHITVADSCWWRCAPPIARMLLRGETACAHVAPITARMPRRERLPCKRPSKSALRKFREEQAGRASDVVMPDTSLERVLRLLRHSMTVTHTHKLDTSIRTAASVLALDLGLDATVLLDKSKSFNKEVTRKARMRFDVLAMHIWRAFFKQVSLESVDIYLFVDGSPQYRGKELFAASMDVFIHSAGGTVERFRRLLPVVSIGRQQLDTVGKTVSLLWQLTLMVGASMLPKILRRVRGILTDNGTERKIHTMPNFLRDYYWFIREPPPPDVDQCAMLMPRVLRSSGWRHTFDNVIKKGMCTLDFFPGFLVKLKAIVKFFRDKSLMDTLATSLKSRGLGNAAAVLCASSLPSFAHWRWSTLHKCVSGVSGIIRTFANVFDPALFHNMRDRTLYTTVVSALASGTWASRELDFVCWFAAWITPLQNFAGSCPCHPDGCR